MEFKYFTKSEDKDYIVASRQVTCDSNLSLEAKGTYLTLCFIAQEIEQLGMYEGNKIDLETLTHYASANDKKETLYKSVVELALNNYVNIENGNIPTKILIGLA